MRVMHVLLAVVLSMFLPAPLAAQSQITTSVIEGVVSDASGAVLPGVTVEIRNVDTNFTRTPVSDREGRFVALQLPPGRYTVTFKLAGFATLVQEDVNVSVGETWRLTPMMKLSGVAETVTVTTQTATVDTSRTNPASTLNARTIETTPILGRKFEDLLTLTPGVSVVQGPDGDEITFAGQRGVFNNISLDGGDYNNGFFGEQMGGQRAAIDITLEAVKEFQVVATGANAEYGRTAGGVVNVITKSGTNLVKGSLFYFQRLEGLTSDTSDGKPLTDFHREQFGGTVGGPIVKNKAFYFLALEGIREKLLRPNLSEAIGTPCPVSAPTIAANEALIDSSPDCQRVAAAQLPQSLARTRRWAAGQAHRQQQRAAHQAGLEPEPRQQPVGLLQLRLLGQPEPDLRRRDLRHVGQRNRGAVEDQHPEREPVQYRPGEQVERAAHHVLARGSSALRDRSPTFPPTPRWDSAPRSDSGTRSSSGQTSTSS